MLMHTVDLAVRPLFGQAFCISWFLHLPLQLYWVIVRGSSVQKKLLISNLSLTAQHRLDFLVFIPPCCLIIFWPLVLS